MNQDNGAGPWRGWSVPECPFLIAYSREVLDDIRLAVMDAFFSIPRGGAEIGGILLGRYEDGRVVIYHQQQLDCEHRTGPSFTLSDNDHAQLSAMLEAAARNPNGMVPVGWWHSHTRSEIFLSEADLAVHEQYFPEPWQIALVVKPHSFQPARAGFFFREPDGRIRAEATYGEFVVEPVQHRTVAPPQQAAPAPPRRRDSEVPASVLTLTREGPPQPVAPPPVAAPKPVPSPALTVPVVLPAPLPAAASAPLPAPAPAVSAAPAPAPEVPLPSFAQLGPTRSYAWLKIALCVLAGVGLGAAAYQTRSFWLNSAISWHRPVERQPEAPAAPPPALGLRTMDSDGQLFILWDRTSHSVRSATAANLLIREGTAAHSVDLDATQIQAGSFTYGRQQERVDVTLTLSLPNGDKAREVTTYLGKLPERSAAADTALKKQNQKLATDLDAERARSRRLEDSLKLQQQRKRMEKQLPAQ